MSTDIIIRHESDVESTLHGCCLNVECPHLRNIATICLTNMYESRKMQEVKTRTTFVDSGIAQIV